MPSAAFDPEAYSRSTADQIRQALDRFARRLRLERNRAELQRRQIEYRHIKGLGKEGFFALEKKYRNDSVTDLVKNRGNPDDYRLAGNRIIRLSEPIFSTDLGPWDGAPFFAGTYMVDPLPPAFLQPFRCNEIGTNRIYLFMDEAAKNGKQTLEFP